MRILLAALLFLLSASAVAVIYKWVDADGKVHYSDHAPEGAEQIDLPEDEPRAPVPQTEAQLPGTGAGTLEVTAGYEQLAILQPEPDETLRNDEGKVAVKILVEPELQEGHKLSLIFDGIILKGEVQQELVLQPVIRGPHSLQVHVLDEDGRVIGRSNPVRFFLLQTTRSERELAAEEGAKEFTEEQAEQREDLFEEQREVEERPLRDEKTERAVVEDRESQSDWQADDGGVREIEIIEKSPMFDPTHPSFKKEKKGQFEKDAKSGDFRELGKATSRDTEKYTKDEKAYPYRDPESRDRFDVKKTGKEGRVTTKSTKYKDQAKEQFSKETAKQQFGKDAAKKAFAPPTYTPP